MGQFTRLLHNKTHKHILSSLQSSAYGTQTLPLDTSLEVHFLMNGYEKPVEGKEEGEIKIQGVQSLH